MRKIIFNAIGIIILSMCFHMSSYAAAVVQVPEVTVMELVEESNFYDKKHVSLEVEAIGDMMVRGDDAVFNGLDATSAIGIWIKSDQSSAIKHLGSYKVKGDRLKVVGTFNKHCQIHGGDSDFHAESFEIIEKGYYHELKTEKNKLLALLTTTLLLIVTSAVFIRKRGLLQ